MTNSIKTSLTHNPKEKKKGSLEEGREAGRESSLLFPGLENPSGLFTEGSRTMGGLEGPESPAALRTHQDVQHRALPTCSFLTVCKRLFFSSDKEF